MVGLKKILWAAVLALAAFPVSAVELVMVEEAGCIWCKRWNAEIAPAYPNTAEGRFAPLRRVDIHALPDGIELRRRVTFTPTFLVVEDNRELGRMEGYPGENFFWPMLADLLQVHARFAKDGS